MYKVWPKGFGVKEFESGVSFWKFFDLNFFGKNITFYLFRLRCFCEKIFLRKKLFHQKSFVKKIFCTKIFLWRFFVKFFLKISLEKIIFLKFLSWKSFLSKSFSWKFSFWKFFWKKFFCGKFLFWKNFFMKIFFWKFFVKKLLTENFWCRKYFYFTKLMFVFIHIESIQFKSCPNWIIKITSGLMCKSSEKRKRDLLVASDPTRVLRCVVYRWLLSSSTIRQSMNVKCLLGH